MNCSKKGCPRQTTQDFKICDNCRARDKRYKDNHKSKIKIKNREYQKQQRLKHKESGVCLTCGSAKQLNKLSCINCQQRATASRLKNYNNFKLNDKCSACGEELNGNKFRCQKCHTAHLLSGKKQWREKRQLVLNKYGTKCACCKISVYEFLELDHINGGGTQHRNLIGTNMVRWIIKNNFPPIFQILCANCNRSKGKFEICQHIQEPTKSSDKSVEKIRTKRHKVLSHYGSKCVCCSESNWTFLEFDHINNDGNVQRQNQKAKLPKFIDGKYPSNIQLLCCNCNKAKGLYGFCPHKPLLPQNS